jgi:hypothetical protein
VKLDAAKLAEQGLKYYGALRSLLVQQNRGEEEIEVIFVLGHRPLTAGRGRLSEDEYIRDRFKPFDGRHVLYDQLIENANRQYDDYLQASDVAKALDELLAELTSDSSQSKAAA